MRRVLVALSLIIITLPLLMVALAPPVARMALEDFFRSLGAERAEISLLKIDWLSGRVDLRGLEVHADGSRVLGVNTFGMDWRWSELMNGELRQLDLSGVFVELEPTDSAGWQPRGLRLPEDQPTAGAEGETSSGPIALGLRRLDVREARVVLSDEQRRDVVLVDRLELNSDAPLSPEPQARLHATLGVADGKIIAQTDISDWWERPSARGELTLVGIALERLPLIGSQTLKGGITGRQAFQADLQSVSLDGHLGISDLDLNELGQRVQAKELVWNGRVVSDLKAEAPSVDGVLDLKGARIQSEGQPQGQDIQLASLNSELRGGLAD
ncbi:MAG: hypothetical protein ACPG4N_03990, partial [Gammaproteobacteria bacterium]